MMPNYEKGFYYAAQHLALCIILLMLAKRGIKGILDLMIEDLQELGDDGGHNWNFQKNLVKRRQCGRSYYCDSY